MSLFKKLLEFQKEVGAITKDSENPFFKSYYFDVNKLVEEVKPVLSKYGVVLLQPLSTIENKPALKTILIDSESGEKIEDIIVLPEIFLPEKTSRYKDKNGAEIEEKTKANIDSQKMGAAITYYRRYALQSLLFLQAEDDDGNTASQPNYKPVITPTNNNNGACTKCGGPMVMSKQGKPYCKNVCWKKGQIKQQLPTINANEDDDAPLPEPFR